MHLISCHHVHCICIRVRLMHSSIFPVVRFAFRRFVLLRWPFLAFFRVWGLNISGLDRDLPSGLGLLPVDRLSSFVPFGLRLILQRLTEGPKRPRVCCSPTPLHFGPKPTKIVAYQLELPSNFANVHDVFHVSQLRKCFKTPDRTVNFEDIELQEDLSYREHPVAILEETERKTRNKSIKFLKVKWSQHSDREATWEREDHLRSEYPAFFQS